MVKQMACYRLGAVARCPEPFPQQLHSTFLIPSMALSKEYFNFQTKKDHDLFCLNVLIARNLLHFNGEKLTLSLPKHNSGEEITF